MSDIENMNSALGISNNFFFDLTGYRLIETTAITKRVQRRTHKKRRINKKWAKRYGYHDALDDSCAIVSGDCIYATPEGARRIIMELLRSATKGGAE